MQIITNLTPGIADQPVCAPGIDGPVLPARFWLADHDPARQSHAKP